jgi:hypothetical protein
VKHGLLAQEILLPGEDAEAFKELATRIRTEAQPVGAEEDALVERMITCVWRLRRSARFENGILASEYFGILENRARCEAERYRHSTDDGLREHIAGPILDNAKHQQAVAKGEAFARRAEADTPTLGQAFVRRADTLSKLSRYEAGIERSYYRAAHELQRRQLARQGDHVPAPLAVDVTVTGDAGASNETSPRHNA